MNWDHLRYIEAIAATGTLSKAGKRLGVHQSTVLRRLDYIEERLGVRLFYRSRSGLTLTPTGEMAFRETQRLRSEVDALERTLVGQDERPSGPVRLATTDTLLNGLINPILGELAAQYPGIQLEIDTRNEVVSLSRRDADIALRPTNSPLDTLVGRRIADIHSAVYGSEDHLALIHGTEEEGFRSWVVPDDSFNNLSTNHWYRDNLQAPERITRCNSLLSIHALIRAGVGVGIIPCYLGDTTAGLRRLTGTLGSETVSLWLLTHRDVQKMGRIRVVMDFLADKLRPKHGLLEGKGRFFLHQNP